MTAVMLSRGPEKDSIKRIEMRKQRNNAVLYETIKEPYHVFGGHEYKEAAEDEG